MLRPLSIALAMSISFAGAAFAEVHEVRMLNKSEDERMVFEPAVLQIAEGDTVKFIAEDRGHNAEIIDGMHPEGAEAFAGKINEEIEVTFDQPGLYGVKCKPHFAMGMVMTIAVGEEPEVPETFLDGKLPKPAKKRFEDQIASLTADE